MLASCAGNIRIDEAKIGGMTPATLILSGRWVWTAAVHLPAHHALGVLHRDAPVARSKKQITAMVPHDDQQMMRLKGSKSPPHRRRASCTMRREAGDDAGEDDERDAVADAALGDLLARAT
jgi:hypothetical protein